MARAAGALVVLALLAGSARAQAPNPEVTRAIETILTATEHADRTAAYTKVLHTVGARDLPTLARGFARITKYGGATYQLVYLTERIKTRESHGLLRTQLQHPIVQIRLYVAYALERLKDRSWVDAFVRAFRDDAIDGGQRATLVTAFNNVKEHVVRDRLVAVAEASDCDPMVGARICTLLANPPNVRYEPLFRKLVVKARPPKVRGAALTGLLALGYEEFIDDLWNAYDSGELADNDLYQSLLYFSAKLTPRMLKFARDVLERAALAALKSRICSLLGAAQDTTAIPLLKMLVRDPSTGVSNAAMDALSRIGSGSLTGFWKELLEDPDARTQVKAARALLQADDRSGIRQILNNIRHDSVTVRRDALQTLQSFPVREAMEPIIVALDDADPTVRTYAWSALGATARAFFPYHGLDLNALGYRSTGPAAGRQEVQRKLRRWWTKRTR